MSVLAIIHVLHFFSHYNFMRQKWAVVEPCISITSSASYCLHDVYFRQCDGKAGFDTKNFDITR